MTDPPRLTPQIDARPDDVPWPAASWPVAPGIVLRGRTVELRPYAPSDAPPLFAALDHDAVWQHVAGRPADTAGLEAMLGTRNDDPAWQVWTVRLTEGLGELPAGAVVGTTSYLETDPGAARTEIGATMYAPAVWATRVNPECKLLLLGLAFDELHMGRVQLQTDVRNARSQQAIARLGASLEGVLRRHKRRQDGSMRDSVLFSVIAEDWPRVRSGLEDRLAAPSTASGR